MPLNFIITVKGGKRPWFCPQQQSRSIRRSVSACWINIWPAQQTAEPTRLTNSQVERMIRDEATMQEMGIDTNGKTMSQLRAKVRARMAAQEQGTQETSADGNMQTPAEETALRNDSAVSQEEASRRMSAGEVTTAVLGENGAKAFRSTYNTDMASRVDAESAATGFNTVYKAALDGRTMTANEQAQTASLPSELKLAAESSARLDRQRTSQAKYFGENAMLVKDDNFKKMHLASKTVRTLDAVAKVAGVQVRFVEKVKEGRANASYGNGVIEIAMDSNDPVMTAFTHEIVHRIRETSPQSYTAMAEFVQKYIGANAGTKLAEYYSSKYGTDNVSYYTEEMVADAFGIILRDGKAMEQFVKDDRSTAQKVLDAVRDLINAVKRALNHQNVELSRNQRTAFMALQSKLTEMESIMAKALEAVPQSAEKNTATMGGEVKYMIADRADVTPTKSQMEKNAEEVLAMEPVHVIFEDKLQDSGVDVKEIYLTLFESWGWNIHSELFGDVAVKKASANSEFAHGSTAQKIASIEAIPSVIRDGKIVDWFEKHANLLRITVAAPVKIGTEKYFMGVMLQRDNQNQRLYIHDVVIEKEAVISSLEHLNPKGPNEKAKDLSLTSILKRVLSVKQLSAQDTTHAEVDVMVENSEPVRAVDEFQSSLKSTDGDFSEAAKAAIKDAQLAGMMNQGRKDAEKLRKAKETTAEVRRKRDDTIRKLKEHQREQKQKASESRNASAIRGKIQRHVADLSRTLRNPTDKKHVPEALRGPVAKLLESINLESKDGAPTKRTQAFNELKKVYAEISENLVIDPDLLGGEGTTGLLDDVIAMADKRIADMNTEELDTIWKAVRAIEASICIFQQTNGIWHSRPQFERCSCARGETGR